MKKFFKEMQKHKNYILAMLMCVMILGISEWKLGYAYEEGEETEVITESEEVVEETAEVTEEVQEEDAASEEAAEEMEVEEIPAEETEDTVEFLCASGDDDVIEEENVYVDGELLEEHTSVYVPTATIRTIVKDEVPVTLTQFKCGRVINYDIDAFIDTVDDAEFLYMLVEAENGNQSSLARRLTADCVLNMVKYPKCPDSIKGAILNKGVFEVVSKGQIFNAKPQESTIDCVDAEMVTQIDYGVMYFRTGHYHNFGVPYEHVGDCWFSKPEPDDLSQWVTEDELSRIEEKKAEE